MKFESIICCTNRTATFASIVSLEDQRGIDSAEGEVVGHDIFAFEMPAATDNVVEIGTVRIDRERLIVGANHAARIISMLIHDSKAPQAPSVCPM